MLRRVYSQHLRSTGFQVMVPHKVALQTYSTSQVRSPSDTSIDTKKVPINLPQLLGDSAFISDRYSLIPALYNFINLAKQVSEIFRSLSEATINPHEICKQAKVTPPAAAV